MRRRVFIAINPPEGVKKELSSFQLKWPELPCRWTKKDNLHITLAFLGYLTDEELLDVCKITKEVGLRNSPFFITLQKIIYGPPRKMRLVWAEGENSLELAKLQKDLQSSLAGLSQELDKEKSRGYSPHITLGRLRLFEFKRMELEERPQINEEISLGFEVGSIDVMESRLKRGGAECTILETCPLSQ